MVSHSQCFLGLSLLRATPYLRPFLSLHLNYCIRRPCSYSLTRYPLKKCISCSTTGLIVKIQFWLLYSKAFSDSPCTLEKAQYPSSDIQDSPWWGSKLPFILDLLLPGVTLYCSQTFWYIVTCAFHHCHLIFCLHFILFKILSSLLYPD